jgi:hypothetical protein
MAELFAYRVVLNGIVLAGSTQVTVFAVYMIYRAFAGKECLTRLRAPIAANVNKRRVYGGKPGRTQATRRQALMFDGHARTGSLTLRVFRRFWKIVRLCVIHASGECRSG